MVTDRVAARARIDFGLDHAESVVDALEWLTLPFLEDDPPGRERVQVAVLLLARGDTSRLLRVAASAETDWRDVLVGAGLADEDWPERIDARLRRSYDAAEPYEP